MTLYLLDTNIISDVIRNPSGAAAMRVTALELEHDIATSVVVACELRFGVEKRGSDRLKERVDSALTKFSVFSLEEPADAAYAELRVALERAGTPISGNDMLIAAHALTLDAILVTDNVREFERIDGLRVENWLR